MRGPPDPEMKWAPLPGSPDFQRPTSPHQRTEAASDYQAEKLRQRCAISAAMAETLAPLVYGSDA
jgi:hypothetical protein